MSDQADLRWTSRVDALAAQLREVLEWARVERAPLREQEVASIRRALADYEA